MHHICLRFLGTEIATNARQKKEQLEKKEEGKTLMTENEERWND